MTTADLITLRGHLSAARRSVDKASAHITDTGGSLAWVLELDALHEDLQVMERKALDAERGLITLEYPGQLSIADALYDEVMDR